LLIEEQETDLWVELKSGQTQIYIWDRMVPLLKQPFHAKKKPEHYYPFECGGVPILLITEPRTPSIGIAPG